MDTIITPELYIENIAPTTTENELKDLFSVYGNVAEVNIVIDRTPQKPQGLGFVTMVTPEGARAAIQALHGKLMGEHKLTVSEAWPGEDHQRCGDVPGGDS
ncbi:MAG TPA: RNA-binding protein [Candidatus Sulfotelmatobacter sp.]|nr:RNA-binding protein [Candidatus Sulfotelmatobacter sp.]